MHLVLGIARCLRSAAVSAAGAACVLSCVGGLAAQKKPTSSAPSTKVSSQTSATSGAVAQTPAVSFAAMAQAATQQPYTTVQLRRFPDGQGQVVSVREKLEVDAPGAGSATFELAFLGVEGELPGSPVWTRWQQTYLRDGALFHKHGSFGVRDLASIQQNYTLHQFGPVVRAGRAAVRIVVFPQTTDKSIWVVDVDQATMVPLYWAEFDFQLHYLSEVEVLTFADSVPAMAGGSTQVSAGTVQHPDFVSARSYLGDPAGLIDPPAALVSYGVRSIETRDDPLNGQQKLVTTYTDGVDQFVVVQVPGTSDVFATMQPPVKGATSSSQGHTIARFQDASLRVLLFWEDGVSFQVAGRGSLSRLDGVAKQLYLQALSTY